MKKESETIQKDYSFLRKMSTEELQEILRRDIDLDKDESDMDLILNVMEVLEARENESESRQSMESALIKLRELINSRDAIFAEDSSSGKGKGKHNKPSRGKLIWLRISSIAAVVVLVISIGVTTATAMGHDLWGGVVKWTKETFRFWEKASAFSTDETFAELNEVLKENGVFFPVLPSWLPEQYSFDVIKVFDEPAGCRITAIATSNEKSICFQLIHYNGNSPVERIYEINGDSVRQHSANGITHYIMLNENSVQIDWARDNYQIMMDFSDITIDAEKIINSIYNE